MFVLLFTARIAGYVNPPLLDRIKADVYAAADEARRVANQSGEEASATATSTATAPLDTIDLAHMATAERHDLVAWRMSDSNELRVGRSFAAAVMVKHST